MKIQITKLRNINPTRFPSEALKEIASQEQEGDSKEPWFF